MATTRLAKGLRTLSLIGAAALLLSACAGRNLLPPATDTLRVESEPSGAEVLVMGKSRGRTPLDVPMKEVFPVTYSPFKYELRGKVELVREGCDPVTVPVGSRSEIRAELRCREPLPAVPETPSPSEAGSAAATPAKAAAPIEAPEAPPAEPPQARERLLRLKELREEGLISEEEFQQLRRRVLETL
jgi:hypothetical protein